MKHERIIMTLTDTHCHINFYDFDDDRAMVLSRAWDSGITRILVPGIDLQTSQTAIDIAESNQPIFAAVGVHPNSANKWDLRSIGYLDEMACHPKVKAIVSSGYSDGPVLTNYKEYGFCAVIVKPYKLEKLSDLFDSIS